jgi:hypothetical protein
MTNALQACAVNEVAYDVRLTNVETLRSTARRAVFGRGFAEMGYESA